MFEDAGENAGGAPGATVSHDAAPQAPTLADAKSIIALREWLAGMVPAASEATVPAESAMRAGRTAGPRFGPSTEELAALTREAEAINRIRALEDLKAACAAAQARETAALHHHRHLDEAARGIPTSRRGRGLGSEIGLARRQNQQRGSTHLRQALHLTQDLPHTLTALQSGSITEEHAATVERHTHWLPAPARQNVDTALADRLPGLGIRDLVQQTQALAHREDPAAAAEHHDQAITTRHVHITPADNGMAYLTALLPALEAAACYQALIDLASTTLAFGEAEGRSPQQVLTDAFVERLTGRTSAETSPVEIQLIMTDTTLLAGGNDPAWIPGHGPLPATMARKLLSGKPASPAGPAPDPTDSLAGSTPADSDPSQSTGPPLEAEARVFLRRLYTSPQTGQLVAMDSQRREFSGKLRHMILLRDNICRTPYCGSPIRHIDHATPHQHGGPTSYANGSGLCARCNYTKEHSGWTHQATPDDLEVTTPTGHRYSSQPRPLTTPKASEPQGSSAPERENAPDRKSTPEHQTLPCTTDTAAVTVKLPPPRDATPPHLGTIDYLNHRPQRRPGTPTHVEYARAA